MRFGDLWSRIYRIVSARRVGLINARPVAVARLWKSRRVFEGIIYVLRTGVPWKALPKEYGAGSSVHAYFQEWEEVSVFLALWKAGLAGRGKSLC